MATVASTETQCYSVKPYSPASGAVTQEAHSGGHGIPAQNPPETLCLHPQALSCKASWVRAEAHVSTENVEDRLAIVCAKSFASRIP